jgi:hypothetical protein
MSEKENNEGRRNIRKMGQGRTGRDKRRRKRR